MPDPTVSEALAEAYAIAPDDEVVIDTLEIRHPNFVDDDGNPDSIWITTNEEEVSAPVEDDAPVKGGQTIIWRSFAFSFALGRIEPGSGAELAFKIDNIDRRIIENLDLAVVEPTKIIMCYRPFLSTDLDGGPQMIPPPSFVLSQCSVDSFSVTGRARVALDLAGAFPRHLYTATEYPGLIGQ